MPNWCSNQLVLQHEDPKQIARAVQAFKNTALLNEFCPCPAELRDFKPEKPGFLEQDQKDANKAKYGFETWYEWSIAHWGVKWDVGDDELDELESDSRQVVLYFDSAWAPPIIGMEHLESAGFTVTLYYWEPSMAFCGKYTTEDGDDCYEYGQITSAELAEKIPADLDEVFGIIEQVHELEESLENDNVETDNGSL
jgi:hypothetical protein